MAKCYPARHIRYNKSAKGLARRDRYNHGPVAAAARKRHRAKPEIQEYHKWIRRSWRLARRLRETTL